MSGAVFGDRVSFSLPFSTWLLISQARQGKSVQTHTDDGRSGMVGRASGLRSDGILFCVYGRVEGLKVRDTYLALLTQSAKIGFWALMPPALVMVLSAGKCRSGSASWQGLSQALVAIATKGRASSSFCGRRFRLSPGGGSRELTGLLRSGGIAGTRDMILLLGFAGAYTGTPEPGMMEEAVRPLVSPLKTRMAFLMAAMGVSVLSAGLASNQAMSVILPARLMEAKRKETGTSREDFAGSLADSGMAAAGVIPWNVMAAICAQSLQVPSQVYAPYSFFLIALPVTGAVYAFLSQKKAGIRQARRVSRVPMLLSRPRSPHVARQELCQVSEPEYRSTHSKLGREERLS